MTNMTESKLSISSPPGKITSYWITTRSFPGDAIEGQYGSRDDNQANMEMPMC
jgi:hypothetical protein